MDKGNLEKKSLNDLRYIAKMMNIKSPTKYKKNELIDIILNSEVQENTATRQPMETSLVAESPAVSDESVDSSDSVESSEKASADTDNKTTVKAKKVAASPKSKKKDDAKEASEKKEAKKPKTAKKTSDKKTAEKKSDTAAVTVVDVVPDEATADENDTSKADGKAKTAKKTRGKKTSKKTEEKTDAAVVTETEAVDKKKKTDEAESKEPSFDIDDVSDGENNETKKDETENVNDNNTPEAVPQKENRHTNDNGKDVEGILEIMQEGYGFLRVENYVSGSKDIYVPPTLIRKYGMKTGDLICGKCRFQKESDKSQALMWISTINGYTLSEHPRRRPFETLTPIYPEEKFVLEVEQKELSTRLIDLIAPIGKGQRGMIVSPPKAGKTVLLKKIANSITTNYPDVELFVLLIDERPEEVTDMKESVKGTVVSSTFDELPERHIKVSELVLERAQRLVEYGKDVVILMDSITRLARAYNLTIPPTGRSLSGGLDPGALHKPKKFFGAARNIRDGGSLTIVATALVDTGSKLDDVIFEEFKGTGNMELHLDRKLSEKRIFPAIDINKSGTRREDLLLTEKELNTIFSIRRAMSNLGTADVTEILVNQLTKTENNEEFIASVKFTDKEK
ncbi:MAG: transcription termination factor Rho [Clostridia bacterium]|nr:transcription termination factor Rho [Clostridia bacterium]